METIRQNSRGKEVTYLQHLLNMHGYSLTADGIFGKGTDRAVREFQTKCGLTADGIVGTRTWEMLESDDVEKMISLQLTEEDFQRCATTLDVEVATVKAVQEVETGGRGGFFEIDKPAILFEGHIFWNELKKRGKNPEDYTTYNEDILYPKWSKEHYKGGIKEYERLERAIAIDEEAAISSASWGLFQIMGFNYATCKCDSVQQFVALMKENEGKQLDLFTAFIQSNRLDTYLRNKDWAGFAKRYNGPAYAENQYDKKLEKAYHKHKC
ncbi:MAG: N-acetylmuramidase family protein [Bacteroidaceae bacterium]|nr:N-acetylmuramidase family protein [Bacteroidaceae bacterium]